MRASSWCEISDIALLYRGLRSLRWHSECAQLLSNLEFYYLGRVTGVGPGAGKFEKGDRVGIAWINWACGRCSFCVKGEENLCDTARWTGKDADGGYAEYTVVSEDFAYPIPEQFTDVKAAPLLCAGVIGYRALRLSGLVDGNVLGLYGFGASAHIVIQVARYKYPRCRVFVFSRGGARAPGSEEPEERWQADHKRHSQGHTYSGAGLRRASLA